MYVLFTKQPLYYHITQSYILPKEQRAAGKLVDQQKAEQHGIQVLLTVG